MDENYFQMSCSPKPLFHGMGRPTVVLIVLHFLNSFEIFEIKACVSLSTARVAPRLIVLQRGCEQPHGWF